MRVAFLISLVLWAPLAASAQDQKVVDRVLGNVPAIAVSQVDAELPAGSILVEVVDGSGAPVPDAAVRLGIMEQSGGRDSKACVTGEDGTCAFDSLLTDSAHSYRVNVPYNRARYSSRPFRLDADKGQRVRVRRLPTTTDDRRLFQVLGRTMIEFHEDRARVMQDARVSNLGDATYVFPEEGLEIPLPEGAKAFDSQPLMSDQRLSPTDEGFEISGSVPPGQVRLNWGYDLPIGANTLLIEQAVPFRTMEYQVISDYIDGMSLEVEGFTVARVHEAGDRRFLVAGVMRRPGDPALGSLRIRIRGIPGSGPFPYLAAAIAAIFGILGLALVLRPSDESEILARARSDRREALLENIAALEREREAERIGPAFYEHRRRELTDELAILLRMQREAEGH